MRTLKLVVAGAVVVVGAVALMANPIEASFSSALRTNPGATDMETYAGGCLQSLLDVDVNEYTQSLRFRYVQYDSKGTPLSGLLGDEIRNVTPGSANNTYSGYGTAEGDVVQFYTQAFSGQNGTGTEVGLSKMNQEVGLCSSTK